MMAQKKTKDPLHDYLIGTHRSFCTYWVFSGDRHCSCGRDKAIKQHEDMNRLLGVTKPTPIQERENKMKVIVIAGYPGSGKSTIMHGLIKRLEESGQIFKDTAKGSVTYMTSKGFIILGSYKAGEKFPGTDRYPMNVQPKACEFLLEAREMTPNKVILMEGDRLFNDKMIEFFKSNEFNIVLSLVQVEPALLNTRREARSNQNESWLKGRRSKVDRMALIYPFTYYLANGTKKEQDKSIQILFDEANGEDKVISNKTTKIKQLWK